MKTLYQEGRIIGLSSYELYIRQMLSRNPDAHILTESQWLAAALGTNNSMILKVEAGTTKGYHDYMLPEGSDLCSCTNVIGEVFEGEVTCIEGTPWAKRVDDYGRLISNNGILNPKTPGMPEDVPVKQDYEHPSQEFLLQCREYMKISAGLILQPGEWMNNVTQVELTNEADTVITTEDDIDLLADVNDSVIVKSLRVDLGKRGFVRLLFNEDIEHDFCVFLHGFSYKNILAGMSGFDDLVSTLNPENGDFLGPQSYPWAVQIMFIYTNAMLSTIQYSVERMENLYYQVVDDMDYFERTAQDLNSKYLHLTNLYADLVEKFEVVVDTVDGMEGRVASLENEIPVINEHFEQVEASIDASNLRITDAETRLNGIDDTLVRVNQKITNLTGEVSDMEIRIAAFTKEFDEDIQALKDSVDAVDAKVGDLAQLTTTNKTQIVRAINEVNSKVPDPPEPEPDPDADPDNP